MRWVLMTALGWPVEPEVEQEFGDAVRRRSRPAPPRARRRSGVPASAEKRGRAELAAVASPAAISIPRPGTRVQRAGIGARVARETKPRRHQIERAFQFSEVLRDQRIGRSRSGSSATPTIMPASDSSACSIVVAGKDQRAAFPRDRPRAEQRGADPHRLLDRRRHRSARARRRLRSRSARKTRSGATSAQCSSRSIQEFGYGGSGCAVRTTTTPSGRVSTIGSSGPNNCFGGLRRRTSSWLPRRPAFAALPLARQSGRLTLAARFSRKALTPRLRLAVALRDGRHQRFHEIADARIALGDARQRLDDGEIGQRRIARHRLARAPGPWRSPRRPRPDIARTPAPRPPPPHKCGRSASCPPFARRQSAAAAAPSRRRRRKCRAALPAARKRPSLGDAHMRGRGQLQPAADHRALQHGDHRHLPELDLLEARCQQREWAMPCVTSRSESSQRSRPAEKCSAVRRGSAPRRCRRRQSRKECLEPAMVSSLRALRLSGRPTAGWRPRPGGGGKRSGKRHGKFHGKFLVRHHSTS